VTGGLLSSAVIVVEMANGNSVTAPILPLPGRTLDTVGVPPTSIPGGGGTYSLSGTNITVTSNGLQETCTGLVVTGDALSDCLFVIIKDTSAMHRLDGPLWDEPTDWRDLAVAPNGSDVFVSSSSDVQHSLGGTRTVSLAQVWVESGGGNRLNVPSGSTLRILPNGRAYAGGDVTVNNATFAFGAARIVLDGVASGRFLETTCEGSQNVLFRFATRVVTLGPTLVIPGPDCTYTFSHGLHVDDADIGENMSLVATGPRPWLEAGTLSLAAPETGEVTSLYGHVGTMTAGRDVDVFPGALGLSADALFANGGFTFDDADTWHYGTCTESGASCPTDDP
jgi:hypothetical protein